MAESSNINLTNFPDAFICTATWATDTGDDRGKYEKAYQGHG